MKIELKNGEIIKDVSLITVVANTGNVISILDDLIKFLNSHNDIEKYGIQLSFATNKDTTLIKRVKAEDILQIYDNGNNKLLNK